MTSRRRYVVLTPFDRLEALAGILKLRRIDADVVLTQNGVVVVKEFPAPVYQDWDISELLGDSPEADATAELENIAADPHQVAALLSQLSQYGVVLLLAELGEDVGLESGVSGQVTAVRYQGGIRGEELAAGLILNSMDPLIEQLVLGDSTPEELGARIIRPADVTDSWIRNLTQENTGVAGNESPLEEKPEQ
ncbi:MAG: hypothetical protein Q4E03_05040 [Trueperella sp.]|nr:hypothetical protein [Trueperella sp.]